MGPIKHPLQILIEEIKSGGSGSDDNGPEIFVIHINLALVQEFDLIEEGVWKNAKRGPYMVRVDAPNPAVGVQKHVTIAHRKHTKAKNQQASWNQDGTRHDKGTFNAKVGALNVVQDIARDALGLPPDVVLENLPMTMAGMVVSLCEDILGNDPVKNVFVLKDYRVPQS